MKSSSDHDDSREKVEAEDPENSENATVPIGDDVFDEKEIFAVNHRAVPTAASFIGGDVDEYVLHPEQPPTEIEQYLELGGYSRAVVSPPQIMDDGDVKSQAARVSLLAANGSFFNGAVGGFNDSMTDRMQKDAFEQAESVAATPIDSPVEAVEEPSTIEKIGNQSPAGEAVDIFADHLRRANFDIK